MLNVFRSGKGTVGKINKQISKTHSAFKAFIKVKKKLEKANDKLSLIVQESLSKKEMLEQAAKKESELQDVALNRIEDNIEAIERIKKLTGEK